MSGSLSLADYKTRGKSTTNEKNQPRTRPQSESFIHGMVFHQYGTLNTHRHRPNTRQRGKHEQRTTAVQSHTHTRRTRTRARYTEESTHTVTSPSRERGSICPPADV
ncbi:hypothetical protein EXIGLDRAFT_478573 [Exidia glandulosa HHB12029]|uniref:Uncharacterized protein n=1 Tax=Exidia glandulosa HHB12029 TaxID=1314781 RepID=A0A165JU62_EXIGL|nr:hypothetical protein EXIGLDRAFT_478573 [Exidia glandulosa HHB12029]